MRRLDRTLRVQSEVQILTFDGISLLPHYFSPSSSSLSPPPIPAAAQGRGGTIQFRGIPPMNYTKRSCNIQRKRFPPRIIYCVSCLRSEHDRQEGSQVTGTMTKGGTFDWLHAVHPQNFPRALTISRSTYLVKDTDFFTLPYSFES